MDYLLAIGGAIVANASNLVGFAMPLAVEYLNADVPDEKVRRNIAIATCLLAAVLLHWNLIENGKPELVVPYMLIILVESQTIFKLYFKNSGTREIVQKLSGTSWKEESEGSEVLDATIAPQTEPIN